MLFLKACLKCRGDVISDEEDSISKTRDMVCLQCGGRTPVTPLTALPFVPVFHDPYLAHVARAAKEAKAAV